MMSKLFSVRLHFITHNVKNDLKILLPSVKQRQVVLHLLILNIPPGFMYTTEYSVLCTRYLHDFFFKN